MKDRTIICIQCGNKFTLTFNEQERLLARGFDFPKRCPDCRKHSRREKNLFEEAV